MLADLAIKDGRVAAVGEGLAQDAPPDTILDARGHYVLPGVLDVHVHLDLNVGALTTADDWLSGTRAAARGGVTSVIDFATPNPLENGRHETLSQCVDQWFSKAEGKACVDYTFHVAITNWEQHQSEIDTIVDRGFTTFKEYMIYAARGLQSDDAALFSTLERMRERGTLLLVHAESSGVMNELIRRHHRKDLMEEYGARLHPMTRPPFVEEEAIQRVVKWSESTGGPLYVVHVSTGGGAGIIGAAQQRGVPVVGETCAHYLTLDESVYARDDGHLFGCCPQMKTRQDREMLWQALQEDVLSVVSTDNCTFDRKQKDTWKGDWTRIPFGLPGLETLLPLVYTQGVLRGRFSLERMVEKLSANPARIMGLAPRKGSLRPGSDADISIIHPKKRILVDPEMMETASDWSPYAGMKLAGFPRWVLSRGEMIVQDYKVQARPGRGEWLPRTETCRGKKP